VKKREGGSERGGANPRGRLRFALMTAIVAGTTTACRPALLSLVAVALAGCATQVAVSVDHDRSANFAALRTYAWRPGAMPGVGDPGFDSTLLDMRVRGAVDRVLAAKGYRQATPGTAADFLVGYYAVVRQKTSFQTVNRRYGYHLGPRGGWSPTYAQDYDQGTLLIDVIDPATMNLLWRGAGTGVVDPDASPEKRERRINEAVDAILAKFPPPVAP
jgi:hypothetical protein